jgi:hypothetical protein
MKLYCQYYKNECLVYCPVLSLLFIVSLSLSAIAKSNAVSNYGQTAVLLGKHMYQTYLNSSLEFTNNVKGLN